MACWSLIIARMDWFHLHLVRASKYWNSETRRSAVQRRSRGLTVVLAASFCLSSASMTMRRAVAAIAFAHLIENFGERKGFAFFLMFFPAALCAHVGRSV